MGIRQRYGRSDLFLVRVYAGEADAGDHGASARAECRGRVQRVVDGETRLFSSWQGLMDTLQEMLLNEKGR
jgi:hypothetical protein